VIAWSRADLNRRLMAVGLRLLVDLVLLTEVFGVIVYLVADREGRAFARRASGLEKIAAGVSAISGRTPGDERTCLGDALVQIERGLLSLTGQPGKEHAPGDGVRRGRLVFLAALGSVLAASALAAYVSLGKFRGAAEPLPRAQVETVGVSVRVTLARILDYGVPLSRLRGIDEYLAEATRGSPGVAAIALTDPSGTVLAASGSGIGPSLPVPEAGKRSPPQVTLTFAQNGSDVALVHAFEDPHFAEKRLGEILRDIVTVALIGALVAHELLLFWTAVTLTIPMMLMRELARAVASGDFARRIPLAESGPFRRLATLINGYLDRLAPALQGGAARPADFPTRPADRRRRGGGLSRRSEGPSSC
jgi:hypothetical protein